MNSKSDQQISMAILEMLKKQAGPVRIPKLARLLGLPMDAKRRIRRLLQALVREGRVVAEGRGRYLPAFVQQEVEGFLVKKGRCFGLASSRTAGSILLSVHPDDRAGALPGDRVRAVSVSGRSRGSTNGRVIEILKRGQQPILGTYRKGRRVGLVVPEDSQLEQPYILDKDVSSELRDGMLVAISVPGQIQQGLRRAKLVRVLGDPGELQTELERIVLEHGLHEGFSYEAEQEVAQGLWSANGPERRDLRMLPHITIDPDDAKDYDDAVFVEKRPSGYRLWVSIADVSFFVKPEGVIDTEAFRRGLSVYFPLGVFPMLPPKLSEDLCTLLPGQDRVAITVRLEIGSSGEVTGGRVFRSLVRTAKRLTYQEVQQILDGQSVAKTRHMLESLRTMADCAGLLLDRMDKRGALDLDLPEQEIRLDEHKQPVEVAPKQRLFAHRIIETFMVTANEAIAELLLAASAPGIYRVHPPPDAEKMDIFFGMAEALGAGVRVRNTDLSPRQLTNFLRSVQSDRVKPVLHQLLLRSLMQARYDASPQGHFGLACSAYLHFTSPIRRYPDLAIHRQLGALLDGRGAEGVEIKASHDQVKWLYSHEQASQIAEWSTQAERRAQEAERAATRLYQVAYMQKYVGQVFEATVSFVVDFGVVVQVLPYGVEGLVHISRMTDDYYRYLPEQIMLIGRRRGKTYRVGDRVWVRVDSIHLSRGEVDLSFVER